MLPLVLSLGFIVIILQLNSLLSLLHFISDRQLARMQNVLESIHDLLPRSTGIEEQAVDPDSSDEP
jgi:hypothetical protein